MAYMKVSYASGRPPSIRPQSMESFKDEPHSNVMSFKHINNIIDMTSIWGSNYSPPNIYQSVPYDASWWAIIILYLKILSLLRIISSLAFNCILHSRPLYISHCWRRIRKKSLLTRFIEHKNCQNSPPKGSQRALFPLKEKTFPTLYETHSRNGTKSTPFME